MEFKSILILLLLPFLVSCAINKPMKDCVIGSKSCSEKDMKIVRGFFGTYEGTFKGDSSGSIEIEITDGGRIFGSLKSGNNEVTLSGVASFINRPFQNYLYVKFGARTKNSGRNYSFTGKIRKDGLLNNEWTGVSRKRKMEHGTVSMHKTAPYKKRQTVAKLAESKVKAKIAIKTNKTTKTDNTKLLDAAKNGKTTTAWKLVNKGYDLNAVDESGATPFCIAMRHGHHQTAQELLVNGSDKNHKDNNGRTPLHYAAIYNAEIITGMLVQFGVDVSAKDKSGKTARDWAIEKKNHGVIRMMDAFKR